MKHKALFIHIPKTGGASMSTAPFVLKHGSFETPPTTDFHRSMIRFSFIRHPFYRFASAALNLDYTTEENFEKFVEDLTLEKIMEDDYYLHLRPMTWYLHSDSGLALEFIGRFEWLKEDWERLCVLCDEEWELPHHNQSGRSYDHLLTDKVKDKLYQIYKKDFQVFDGYKVDKKPITEEEAHVEYDRKTGEVLKGKSREDLGMPKQFYGTERETIVTLIPDRSYDLEKFDHWDDATAYRRPSKLVPIEPKKKMCGFDWYCLIASIFLLGVIAWGWIYHLWLE